MYYIGTILVVIMALIFTIMMFVRDDDYPIFGMLAGITWFSAAAAIIYIEIPYVLENSLNPGTVIEGVQAITSAAPLRWLFIGLGWISFGYTIIMFIGNALMALGKKDGGNEGE